MLHPQAGHMADHFTQQPGPFPMVDVRHSTYECVDARGPGPMLGTPGGDLAEVMKVAMSIMKLAYVCCWVLGGKMTRTVRGARVWASECHFWMLGARGI
jgi:hypothetical protein